MEGREEKPKKNMEIVRVVGAPACVIVVKQEDSPEGRYNN